MTHRRVARNPKLWSSFSETGRDWKMLILMARHFELNY